MGNWMSSNRSRHSLQLIQVTRELMNIQQFSPSHLPPMTGCFNVIRDCTIARANFL